MSFKNTLKEAWWSWVNFSSVEIISKRTIKMISIIRQLKLHNKTGRNSSILTCLRDFNIDSTCWVCRFDNEIGVCQTKIIVVSTLNVKVVVMLIKWHFVDIEIQLFLQHLCKDYTISQHFNIRTKIFSWWTQNKRCFNIKFWGWFNVDKLKLFWPWNLVTIFNVNIKDVIFQAS